MRAKVFSPADRFEIKNGHGQDIGYVEGALLSWGDQLRLLDLAGAEVARIDQRVMAWGPTYDIHRAGVLVATVKKQQFAFSPRFVVDVPGPDDLMVHGDLWDHEYVFRRGDRAVAAVSKAWWSLADTYGVDVNDDEDHVLILASTIVIDCVQHDARE